MENSNGNAHTDLLRYRSARNRWQAVASGAGEGFGRAPFAPLSELPNADP
jgi:hypothetical protein